MICIIVECLNRMNDIELVKKKKKKKRNETVNVKEREDGYRNRMIVKKQR